MDTLYFRDNTKWECQIIDIEEFRVTYYNSNDTSKIYFVPIYSLKSTQYAKLHHLYYGNYYTKTVFKRN
jgi:hypothetical protein